MLQNQRVVGDNAAVPWRHRDRFSILHADVNVNLTDTWVPILGRHTGEGFFKFVLLAFVGSFPNNFKGLFSAECLASHGYNSNRCSCCKFYDDGWCCCFAFWLQLLVAGAAGVCYCATEFSTFSRSKSLAIKVSNSDTGIKIILFWPVFIIKDAMESNIRQNDLKKINLLFVGNS